MSLSDKDRYYARIVKVAADGGYMGTSSTDEIAASVARAVLEAPPYVDPVEAIARDLYLTRFRESGVAYTAWSELLDHQCDAWRRVAKRAIELGAKPEAWKT